MQPIAKTHNNLAVIAKRGSARRIRGFTLIELMIAIAILGVLVASAAPSLIGLVRDQRLKNAAFDMFATLTYARSEALKRNGNINIVRAGATWADGWSVQVQSGGVTTTLRSQSALPNVTVTALVNTNSPITYLGSGRLSTSPAPTFVFSATGATAAPRCVVVNLSGQASVRKDNNTDPGDGCG